GEGSLTVDLDNRLTRGPGVVVHFRWRLGKSARPQHHAFLRVELVAHANVERTRYHRDVLGRRMIVRRDLVACRHFQPDDILAFLEWIAGDDGDLSPCRKSIRNRAPLHVIGVGRRGHWLSDRNRPAEEQDGETQQRLVHDWLPFISTWP